MHIVQSLYLAKIKREWKRAQETTRFILVWFKQIYIQSLAFLTRNFTIWTREGIQEIPMQFLNSKTTLSRKQSFKKCENSNAPSNYTQLPQTQWEHIKFQVQEPTRNWYRKTNTELIQNSDNNETITPDFV